MDRFGVELNEAAIDVMEQLKDKDTAKLRGFNEKLKTLDEKIEAAEKESMYGVTMPLLRILFYFQLEPCLEQYKIYF